MDRIEIPQDQVVPMDSIAPGVEGLRITFVNVFGITHSDGSWTLIDAATPFTTSIIRKWAEKQFCKPPNAIVLSHGHFDHVGAARELSEAWGVPIHAHLLEFPFLSGRREYPAPNPGAGGGLMSWISPLLPRGPVNIGDKLIQLPDSTTNVTLDKMPGWQIIHTPGHTPGHVSFFRPEDRTMLPADAFCTTKPESFFSAAVTQAPELHGPPAYFTWNWDLARQSVQNLAALDPLVVAPGHGRPLSGPDIPAALRELAARFNEVAVPDNRNKSAA